MKIDENDQAEGMGCRYLTAYLVIVAVCPGVNGGFDLDLDDLGHDLLIHMHGHTMRADADAGVYGRERAGKLASRDQLVRPGR